MKAGYIDPVESLRELKQRRLRRQVNYELTFYQNVLRLNTHWQCWSKWKYYNLGVVIRVPQTTHTSLISRSCFAEHG